MKNKLFPIAIAICLSFSSLVMANGFVEARRVAANTLWSQYSQNPNNPSVLPAEIPLNLNNPNIDEQLIAPNHAALKSAMVTMAQNNGGIIKFNNANTQTIYFNDIVKAIDIQVPDGQPIRTILIQGADKIIFDGSNKSSIFVMRRNIQLIVQNAVFQNCQLKQNIITNPAEYRVGGGAIEIALKATLRVRGCEFKNNLIPDYDYIGENQNGAAIRFNTLSTGEIFDCKFINNKAVTGGAIGATSIKKITIMDCLFDGNIANAYRTKNSNKRSVTEAAGAVRVDRSQQPLEIYRTTFQNNASNIKSSVIEFFTQEVFGVYPNPNGFALIIDDCLFQNNKHYGFFGANDPNRDDWFYGDIMFHHGAINNNFRGARMKISNSKFINNEAGESNIRVINDFLITNTIFANTQFLPLTNDQGQSYNRGAIMLQLVPRDGEFRNCTFYKNEIPAKPNNQVHASDIFFFDNSIATRTTLFNSIFYRTTSNTSIKQVKLPLQGTGNNQYIPGVNMTTFPSVSQSNVNTTNPNIIPNNITNMCLGTNSLPTGIGGLSDCGNSPPPPPTTQLIADGTYYMESTTSTYRMEEVSGNNAVTRAPQNVGSQKWVFTHEGNNIYTIKNSGTNRYLSTSACGNLTNANTASNVSGNNEKWQVVSNGTGVYGLKPAHCIGQGLDRNNGATNPSTNVHTYAYAATNPNQKWKIIIAPTTNPVTQLIADGTYYMESTTSTSRMEEISGNNAVTRAPQNVGSQKWVFTHEGNNIYRIKNSSTNRYLSTSACGNLTNANTAANVSGNNQKWQIVANGAGVYGLKPAHCTTQGLDRNFGTSNPNTNVHTYAYSASSANQKWKIITAPATNPVSQLIADGTYYMESTTSTYRMEEVSGNNAVTRAPQNVGSQKWVFTHEGNNIYTIKNSGTNRYLSTSACGNLTNANTAGNVSGNNEKWQVVSNGTGVYGLKPAHCTGQGLDRNNGTTNPSTNVHTYAYTATNPNQKWKIELASGIIENGTYYMESTTSTYRMDEVPGNNAVTRAPQNVGSQKWVFTHEGNDIYTIKNSGTNRYLSTATCANLTNANTASSVFGNKQKWKVVANGTGVYGLKPAHCTGQGLDRNFGTTNPSTNVHTYAYSTTNPNQKWNLTLTTSGTQRLLTTNIEGVEDNEVVELEVYPNPVTNGVLNITNPKIGIPFIIYDALGRIKLTGQMNNQINVQVLTTGIYFLQVEQQVKKIIISK